MPISPPLSPLCAPGAARARRRRRAAAELRAGEVIVKYRDGTTRQRPRRPLEDATGTDAEQRAARRLRAARDRGRRVGARDGRRAARRPERGLRGAELRRARGRSSSRTTPDCAAPVELLRAARHRHARGLVARRGGRRARAAAAPSWRCSTAAWPTSATAATGARPTCAARRFVQRYDFVDRDRHPNDVFGHGTHVAGTIAQATNNGTRRGRHRLRREDHAAAGARLTRARATRSAIARAIRYAAKHGADVINLSARVRPTEVRAAEIPDVLVGDPLRAPQEAS